MRFISLSEVDSTNAEARRLAEQGEAGPLWVSSNLQTAGRARRGRDWISKSGNLYVSGLYPDNGIPQQAAQLSFAAALAVAETLAHYVPDELITLKWPNDVLLGGKKTSGVLLEGGNGYVIIGIGINLTHHPEGTEFPATYVLEHVPSEKLNDPEPIMTGPHAVLAILAQRFDHWRGILVKQGFLPLREAWMSRAHNIPGQVTVRLPNESFTGEALGLDTNGALRVRLADGTIRDIHAGDVFFGAEGI